MSQRRKAKTSSTDGVYTMADVKKHNTFEDCWLVYEGQVLDVTSFVPKHPGLPKTLVRFAGMDATDEIRQMHQDWVIKKQVPLFVIGTVSDAPEPNPVQVDMRLLYEDFVKKGYFDYTDFSFYYIKLMCYLPLILGAWYLVFTSRSNWAHVLAAVMLGTFYWQVAFVGHDAGHMACSGNRKKDYDYGLIAGNFLSGISIGWWKSTHNVHHAVPNALHSDPDIAHLPVFAVDSRMFNSLYNTYHNRVMKFDAIAQFFVPYQHYLYYPIMFFARFNLYLQSFILLFKDPFAQRRLPELMGLIGFWCWQYYLMGYLNSRWMVLVFQLLSNGLAGILHVQITLSHFSMPVVDDFKTGSYGGDFFTRNVLACLDVSCPEWLDWVHGGLQFQTEHHCFPRLARRHLRKAKPAIRAVCEKHGLPWNEMSFIDCNRDVIRVLRESATKAKVWSPMIAETFNARG